MNEKSMQDKRQSNIELLRIVAMILIVAHHFSVHGGFEFPASSVTVNKLWIQFIQIGGKIGVNIFVLISGYFLIDAKNVKISKILKLWLRIFTYSVILFLVFVLTGVEPFQIREVIIRIFPVTLSHWWFPSTYFVLYLLSPYLNKLLKSLDKNAYQKLIVLTTVCWCIIPTFFESSYQSNNLIWFMYLYAVAGYIKLHITNINISNKKCIIIALILTALTFLVTVGLDFIGIKVPIAIKYTTYLYGMQTLPIMLISLFMFLGFLKTDIKYSKAVNTLASTTFGVYLIHDDGFMSKFLWHSIFKNATFSNSAFLIPYSIAVIIAVFLGCALIEFLRMRFIEKHYTKLVDRISDNISKYIDKFFSLKAFKSK